MENLKLKGEYITLGQILKLKGFAYTGGHAAFFLEENDVTINGEIDRRRGRKIRNGDIVCIQGEDIKIEG